MECFLLKLDIFSDTVVDVTTWIMPGRILFLWNMLNSHIIAEAYEGSV